MQRVTIVVALLISMASCAVAGISDTGEVHRFRLLSGPADQTRPSWAPVRPLYGNHNLTPLLHGLLKSQDSSERARGAFLLGLIGERDSADRIAVLLKDSDRVVRVSSGLALGFLGDERGIHVCDSVLKADPGWIRYYAVYALWFMNSQRAGAVLQRNVATGIPWVDKVIGDARKTRHEAPSRPPSPSLGSGYEPKAEDLWPVVCDSFIAESDHWWHEGDYNQTIRCQEVLIFLDPTYAEGYSLIAWLQWSMGDDASAVKTLNRGTRDLPDSPDTWGALGQHYWMTKRYALALEPLRKSIELGGDHLIRRPYAYCLEKQGRIEECLAQWNEIARECPEDPAAKPNIERLRKILAEQEAGR